MTFDVSLPFVSTVYDFVARGELDKCVDFLEQLIRKNPATPLHCIFDHTFDRFFPEYSAWLFEGCDDLPTLDPGFAITTSMGEFEINYHNWTASATVYENYQDTTDPYKWLCESERFIICDRFRFAGMDQLADAFESAYEYDTQVPNAKPPYDPETFTAVCYLFFANFLQLNRKTHDLARVKHHKLASAHLFCDYGDCLYHSPPQQMIEA